MEQWLIAFPIREDTSLDLWLTKTPRPEHHTKHERRAKRKADEVSYAAAYRTEETPSLSGLRIIPRKGRSGTPPVKDPCPPKPKGEKRPTPPSGYSRRS